MKVTTFDGLQTVCVELIKAEWSRQYLYAGVTVDFNVNNLRLDQQVDNNIEYRSFFFST